MSYAKKITQQHRSFHHLLLSLCSHLNALLSALGERERRGGGVVGGEDACPVNRSLIERRREMVRVREGACLCLCGNRGREREGGEITCFVSTGWENSRQMKGMSRVGIERRVEGACNDLRTKRKRYKRKDS